MAEGNVSLNPDDFVEGGALLDDVDVVFTDSRFIMGDYGGKADMKVPMHLLTMKVEGDDEGESHEQFYSVGGAGDFVPTEDGMGLTKIGTKSNLVKSTNFGMLMKSLTDAGFPKSDIDSNNIGFLVGVRAHMVRKVVERKGLARAKTDRDQTVLVVERLLDTKKGGKAGGGKVKTGAGTAVPDSVVQEAQNTVLAVLAEAGGTIAKKDLMQAALKLDAVKNSGNKAKVVNLLTKDDFLGGIDSVGYADGVLTLG